MLFQIVNAFSVFQHTDSKKKEKKKEKKRKKKKKKEKVANCLPEESLFTNARSTLYFFSNSHLL